MEEERIGYEEVITWGTPRRITLMVKGLADMQSDLEEEVRGPAVKAAYDAEGNPTKAVIGFAKGQGVEVDSLITKEMPNGSYVFAIKKAVGKKSEEIFK